MASAAALVGATLLLSALSPTTIRDLESAMSNSPHRYKLVSKQCA